MSDGMLRVYANPYTHVDAKGRPAGAVQIEGVAGRFVGATLKTDGHDPPLNELLYDGKKAADRWFDYDTEPARVPPTAYYVQLIQNGDLIAADEHTAREVGFAKFTSPLAALNAACERAIADYVAHYGRRPAFADGAPNAPKEGE